MNKLLVICGPTATGKTQLALHLSKLFNGELISADSRQVYKYMDIGTGKDAKNILGYDLVEPNEEFSVSQYVKFANNTIKNIYEQKKLPILVGGTGLYIKAVCDGIDTLDIAPDKKLRKELSNKTAEELFVILNKINSNKAKSMNDSDRKNPRRLIRAIEVASQLSGYPNIVVSKPNLDILFIGLTTRFPELKIRIDKRVDERIKMGFEKEIEFLKKNGFWDVPRVTLGYKDWPDIEKWKLEEFKYAKRQMTWFKKEKRINWFNIDKKDYRKAVEKSVIKWYSQAKDAKKN